MYGHSQRYRPCVAMADLGCTNVDPVYFGTGVSLLPGGDCETRSAADIKNSVRLEVWAGLFKPSGKRRAAQRAGVLFQPRTLPH